MAIFNYIIHQAILGHLAFWGLKAFPGWPRWGLKPPCFLTCSTSPYLDLEQAITWNKLFIIATNRWVHCNAYKHPETSAFIVLFHFRT